MSEEYREEKSASANFIGMLLEKIYDFEKKCHEVETNNNEIKIGKFHMWYWTQSMFYENTTSRKSTYSSSWGKLRIFLSLKKFENDFDFDTQTQFKRSQAALLKIKTDAEKV